METKPKKTKKQDQVSTLKPTPTAIDTGFLFDCFLPYRDSLHLERWVTSLLRLQKILDANIPILENHTYAAHISAHYFFPDLKSPYYSEEDWVDFRKKEIEFSEMSEEEKNDKIEEDSIEIRRKIESGELDIWDDSPVYVNRPDVEKFFLESISLLKAKFFTALNPNASFIEGLIKEAISLLESSPILKNPENPNKEYSEFLKNRINTQKGLHAIFSLWDTGRIHHEGEPPYKIAFSSQVAEALGIDPTLESVRLQKLSPLSGSSLKRFTAAYNVSKKFRPQIAETLTQIYNYVEKNSKGTPNYKDLDSDDIDL